MLNKRGVEKKMNERMAPSEDINVELKIQKRRVAMGSGGGGSGEQGYPNNILKTERQLVKDINNETD